MLEVLLSLFLIVLAAILRPWRMLKGSALVSPAIALAAVLPVVWTLALRDDISLYLQWSGACLAALCLGWPLAILLLTWVGVATWLLAQAPAMLVLDLTLWHGLIPATLNLFFGLLLRRYARPHPLVYVAGRAMVGTALSLYISTLLAVEAGHPVHKMLYENAWVAYGFMAWGDAIFTGMLVALFVAFRPQWLATWSPVVYHQPPEPPAS